MSFEEDGGCAGSSFPTSLLLHPEPVSCMPIKRSLLGVDVGFSATRATTGIAWYDGEKGEFGIEAVGSDKCSRLECLPPGLRFDVAALDGPWVPLDDPTRSECIRLAERCLSRGMFQRRCKPGFSHFGYGRQLRAATARTADQFAGIVTTRHAIVEAFPNAFLGVLLEDSIYSRLPPLRRGRKFDWLYERAVEENVLGKVMKYIGFLPNGLLEAMTRERHHEKRAAHVCLLTAACEAAGRTEKVGDITGGWITLPARKIWANWAQNALPLA